MAVTVAPSDHLTELPPELLRMILRELDLLDLLSLMGTCIGLQRHITSAIRTGLAPCRFPPGTQGKGGKGAWSLMRLQPRIVEMGTLADTIPSLSQRPPSTVRILSLPHPYYTPGEDRSMGSMVSASVGTMLRASRETLRALDLSGWGVLSVEGRGLLDVKRLTSLTLNGTVMSVEVFHKMITENGPTLRHLRLADCHVHDLSLIVLQQHVSLELRTLWLDTCCTEKGSASVVRAVGRFQKLEELRVGALWGGRGGEDILAVARGAPASLRRLIVSSQRRTVMIYPNRDPQWGLLLGEEEWAAVLRELAKKSALRELDVGGMGCEVMGRLVGQLTAHPVPSLRSLTLRGLRKPSEMIGMGIEVEGWGEVFGRLGLERLVLRDVPWLNGRIIEAWAPFLPQIPYVRIHEQRWRAA